MNAAEWTARVRPDVLGSSLGAVMRHWNERTARSRVWDVVVVGLLQFSVFATVTGRAVTPLGVALMVIAAFVPLVRRSAPGVAVAAGLIAVVIAIVTVPDASVDLSFLVALAAFAADRLVRESVTVGAAFVVAEAARLVPLHPPAMSLDRYLVLCAVVAAIIGFGAYRHSRRQLVQQWQDRIADLEVQRETVAALAAGAERLRLAREMHDTVGHHLTVVVMMAEGGRRVTRRDGSDQRAADAFDTIATTARKALEDTRDMLDVLRNEPADDSMASAADATVDSMFEGVRSVGLRVSVTGRSVVKELPAAVREVAIRVMQEALTNAVKYAGPGSAVAVNATRVGGTFELAITDDGAGRALRQPPSSGIGLESMQARALDIGGCLDVGPVDPTGWSVRLRVPSAFRRS